MITLGNYGNTDYIYYSSNAAITVQETGNFVDITGNLPQAPVYTALIHYNSSLTAFVGTEYGIYSTDNILDNPVSWTDETPEAMGNVPVYDLFQQVWENSHYWGTYNHGYLYAATNGRGIWVSDDLKGPAPDAIDENFTDNNSNESNRLHIYPNPVQDKAYIEFDLPANGDVRINIYSLSGQIIDSRILKNQIAGNVKANIQINDCEKGTYIVKINSGNYSAVGKLLKN